MAMGMQPTGRRNRGALKSKTNMTTTTDLGENTHLRKISEDQLQICMSTSMVTEGEWGERRSHEGDPEHSHDGKEGHA
jgi:hypothetical protein